MLAHEIIEIFVDKHEDLYRKMKSTEHSYKGLDAEKIKPNPFHLESDVWTHTMMVLKVAEFYGFSDRIHLACICHDLGKHFTFKDNPEKERRSFFSHESVSTFYTRQVLESFDLTLADKEFILKIVSLHGHLYGFFVEGRLPVDIHQKIADRFDSETFQGMIDLYTCDHEGRFYNMGTNMHGAGDLVKQDFNNILALIKKREKEVRDRGTFILPENHINILIGTPRAGKSTLVEQRFKNTVVISRDALLEKRGIGETYTEKWTSLTDKDHRDIDKQLNLDFQAALNNKDNITIDMTNMSSKSRKKWLSDKKVKSYHKRAFVVIESRETVLGRMTPEKNILPFIIDGMMKRYVAPTLEEFDTIEYILP